MKPIKFEPVHSWRQDPEDPDKLTLHGEWSDIIDSFDVKTLLCEYTGSYQGDIHYLLRDGDEYAFLTIGYGSCSGCDWMSSMNDYGQSEAEWYKVRDDLYNSIQWKTRKELLAWFRDEARKRDYSWYEREYPVVVAKCIAKLAKKKFVAPEESDD